jgi:hypothetical protein
MTEAANMSERNAKESPGQALLRRIIEENPKGSEREWRAQFEREVMDDPKLARAIVEETVNDILKDLRRSRAN